MKIIPKKQRGGTFASYFVDYNPVVSLGPQKSSHKQEATQSSNSSDNEKGKITEADLFKTLDKLKGLPNEVVVITQRIKAMHAQSSILGNSSSLASNYADIIASIKIAEFNATEYTNAFNEVKSNSGLNEIAVTPYGEIVVYNKDKEIKQISVQEYLKNKDKYSPLTNSNILYLRAHDASYANNNQILDIVTNGIGIDKVHDMIKSRMMSIGATETTIEGYTSKQSNQIKSGIKVLNELSAKQIADGMTVDGLYKARVIEKDQKEQADAALKYIYDTLPNNAKAILQLHSGNAKDPVQGARSIIGTLIVSQLSPEHKVELNYLSELNADGTKRKSSSDSDGDGDGDEKDVYNTASLLIMGKGQQQMQVINPGSNLAFSVLTSSLPLVNSEGKPIGKNHTLKTITESQYAGILDFDHATMGGAKIDELYYGSVIVNSDKISVLDFPVDQNGNPDLRPTTIEAKRKADQMMKQAGIDTSDKDSIARNANKVNQILKTVGLNAAYNSQGEIVSGNWKRFAVLNATADDRALGLKDMDYNPQLLEVTDDNQIDQLIGIIKSENSLDKYDFDKNEWYDINGHNSFYQGTVWIPVIDNYFSAQSGSGQKMKMQQIHDINKWEHKQYVSSNYVKPPTL